MQSQTLSERLDSVIQKLLVNSSSQQTENLFDLFVRICQKFYEEPVHSIAEMKSRENKKLRGDLFEEFCCKYLVTCYGLRQAWLLSALPGDIRTKLGLSTRDFGIDIIGVDNEGRYYAVQAKYRKQNPYKEKTGISWKQLATFYALVYRTGPYFQHVVITNVDYVRHIGKKTVKDRSICIGTLRNITRGQWMEMAFGDQGQIMESQPKQTGPTIEELRELRLKKFG